MAVEYKGRRVDEMTKPELVRLIEKLVQMNKDKAKRIDTMQAADSLRKNAAKSNPFPRGSIFNW